MTSSSLTDKKMFPETKTIEICTHLPDGYKDICQRLLIKGCVGCWYRRFRIKAV